MKPEAQRIAIAKACGWKIEPRPEWPAYPFSAHTVTTPTGEFLGTISDEAMFKKLPDYLNDLNAMHEAEKIFGSVRNWTNYITQLSKIVWANYSLWELANETSQEAIAYRLSQLAGATAEQRAEAFLKTLGLWKDE